MVPAPQLFQPNGDFDPAVNVTLLAAKDKAESCAYGDYGSSTLSYTFSTPGIYFLALEKYTDGPSLLGDLLGKTMADFTASCAIPTNAPTPIPTLYEGPIIRPTAAPLASPED
jgi:hypothetical protein